MDARDGAGDGGQKALIGIAPTQMDAAAWNRLSEGAAALNLLQTWEYGAAKAETSSWDVERHELTAGDATAGLVQTLVRKLPLGLGGVAWVNRGPIAVDPGLDYAAFFADAAAALRRHYVEERGFYLRIAPPVTAEALSADGAPPARFRFTESLGWASAILDLTPPLEQLRTGLNRKWRGHLNRSERAGLSVRAGTDAAFLEAFLEGHDELLSTNRFQTTVTTPLLRALWAALPADRQMMLFIAELDGRRAGSVLMVRYGDTAEYLAGNTTDEGRRAGAGQLLLWRAMEAMRAEGMRRLDLSGMDPVATPKGIYDFKRGLNAAPYRLAADLEAETRNPISQLIGWRVNRAFAHRSA